MGGHEIQDDAHVSNADNAGGSSRLTRLVDSFMHSRWLAAGVMAFAVSYGFHIVEEEGQERLDKQQHILACVVKETAYAQQLIGAKERVILTPILKKCEKQEDN